MPNSSEETILKHTTIKLVQVSSLVTPPILLANAVYRRSFRLSPFLRNAALSTFVLGPAVGFGIGWAKLQGMPPAGEKDRAIRLRSNVGQRRVDDYSIIGGVLGSLLTPAIFLKRAPLPYLVAGGAAFGIAGGVITHVVKNYQDGTTQGVGAMVEEAKTLAKE